MGPRRDSRRMEPWAYHQVPVPGISTRLTSCFLIVFHSGNLPNPLVQKGALDGSQQTEALFQEHLPEHATERIWRASRYCLIVPSLAEDHS